MPLPVVPMLIGAVAGSVAGYIANKSDVPEVLGVAVTLGAAYAILPASALTAVLGYVGGNLVAATQTSRDANVNAALADERLLQAGVRSRKAAIDAMNAGGFLDDIDYRLQTSPRE